MYTCSMWPLTYNWDTAALYREHWTKALSLGMGTMYMDLSKAAFQAASSSLL